MEIDGENELLRKVAGGEPVEKGDWLALRSEILARLEKIAYEAFPIPNLPPPVPIETRLLSPLPSSPLDHCSSQEADKENAPVQKPDTATTTNSTTTATQQLEPGALPKQIADMLAEIKTHISTFSNEAPHTIQRLAELVLSPRAHYKALASYLHAVDRVVQVTSATDVYPLPLTIPDMSSMRVNGEEPDDPAMSVAWSNPAVPSVGSDEALGGALLTPIPWLTRRSPESSDGNTTPGAQIHSESTETIDGPNGMGSIETVSVSVNGVPSMGHARGITQGELLRQEQRAGVVPANQVNRPHDVPAERDEGEHEEVGQRDEGEEEEIPHARGPEEIGVGDTGPQPATTSFSGDGGVNTQDIDVEAAVGRKHDDEEPAGQTAEGEDKKDDEANESRRSPSAESVGSKRDAEQDLEGEPAKKAKEEATGAAPGEESASSVLQTTGMDETPDGAKKADEGVEGAAKEEPADKMET